MGQYLQLGICHRMVVGKEQMEQLKLTKEDIMKKLADRMDMSLFTSQENEEVLYFTLKESVILEQLHGFLQEQFAFYPSTEERVHLDFTLTKLASLQSMQELVKLAEEKSLQNFQSSTIYVYMEAGPWLHQLRLSLSLFLFMVEGKIMMEDYANFLGYVENLIRAKSRFTIAGACRAAIQ